ncbi:uncharacterized protein (DUF362 family) [Halanaerobium saccharolyticum]|uniref:Ferredoxin n=1 Tax=Halanaerobium saccharolyticum TaxID=43595 RepID=A0A4R7YZR1_9FIRM|nr:DUF362 domain-containing protein [Halanaerobium saccharolyticum]RAK07132.1 uncharacterized protein (DUF362 family) [Halanaerobium saccharolyticum]TDW01856.1 uncharacterized protein (DUF362 family) [Halanaerobium saccharolyticum]TDX53102.1 uncharacterized protein (DUF362 family) [Halanaerobium saccharolyticum]
MTIVAAKKCYSYQAEELSEKLDFLLQELGGLKKFIRAGDQVVFKTNLLMGKAPEAAVTTNPEFIRALARKVKELGAEVIIADSPGGPFNKKLLKRAYQKSGLYEMAAAEDLKLNYNTDSKKHEYRAGEINKSFQLVSYLEAADLVINLPKLKTHGLTMYTGAVKNLFGCIPGVLKAEYHLRMQSVDDFSRMLNDLAGLVAPELTIMDAVVGMEGEGPSNGQPRKFNYLLASTSPYYLDLAAVRLMGITPEEKVPSIKAALADQILKKEKLELRGDEIKPLTNVEIPKIEKENNLLDAKLPDFLSDILEKFLRPKPVFKEENCVGCRTCAENCPPDAITMVDDFPEVELDACIRCFCCQELCPYDAVEIKYPLLAKLLFSN